MTAACLRKPLRALADWERDLLADLVGAVFDTAGRDYEYEYRLEGAMREAERRGLRHHLLQMIIDARKK